MSFSTLYVSMGALYARGSCRRGDAQLRKRSREQRGSFLLACVPPALLARLGACLGVKPPVGTPPIIPAECHSELVSVLCGVAMQPPSFPQGMWQMGDAYGRR